MELAKAKLTKLLKNSYMKTILLGVILLGAVFAFWFSLRIGLRTDYPLLAVASGSMVPTLNVGDLIIVQGVPASEIYAAPQTSNTPGDIIVFKGVVIGRPDELIVHRAINKTYRDGVFYFITHGDHNPPGSNEGPFPESVLIGKVVGVVPWIGNVPLFIRTPQGTILLIFLFVLILLIEYFPVPWRKEGEKPKSPTSQNLSVWRNH
jgi:signal peptidase